MRITRVLRLIVVILLACEAQSGSCAVTRSHKKLKLPEICKAGKVYKITKIQDLWDNLDDLECIYRVGEEPTSMLLGPMVGVCFTVGNSFAANPVAKFSWTGKYTMNMTCQGKTMYLGWNGFLGDLGYPFYSTIGRVQDFANLHPIWKDNKTAVILDYSRDFSHYCPKEALETQKQHLKIKRNPYNQMIAPLNFVVDGMRPVGRQKDGGLIYLGQTYARDMYRRDNQAVGLAFFAVISYDENVEKHIKYGHALTPLKEDVPYRLVNSFEFTMMLFPFDNMLNEPIHATKTFLVAFVVSFRNALNYVITLIWNINGDDRKVIRGDLEEIIVKYRQLQMEEEANSTSMKIPLLSHYDGVHSHYNEL